MIHDAKLERRDWERRIDEAAVLASAWRVGLLGPLAEGGTEADLARECGLDLAATRLTLAALRAMGAVEDRGGQLRLTRALRDISPVGLGPLAAVWAGLPDFLRSGVSPVSFGGTAAERGATYGAVVGALGDWFESEAAELAARLDPVRSILDLGAGSAVWSLAMAARAPGTRVVGVDRPDVVPAMIARAAALGLSIEARAGDVFDVELPVVDRVLLANVLHLEPPPVARAMLSLAHGALEPGGRVVIVDVIPDGRAEGAGEAALYAIQLALRVPTGVVHSQRALSEWLRLEGFEAPQRIGLGPGDALAALVAVRR